MMTELLDAADHVTVEQMIDIAFSPQVWHAERWQARLKPIYAEIEFAGQEAQKTFPPWSSPQWQTWSPPPAFGSAAKFAELKVNVDKLAGLAATDQHPELPGPAQFSMPLSLTYPNEGAVLFETTDSGREQSIGALNNIILRLLSVALLPP